MPGSATLKVSICEVKAPTSGGSSMQPHRFCADARAARVRGNLGACGPNDACVGQAELLREYCCERLA